MAETNLSPIAGTRLSEKMSNGRWVAIRDPRNLASILVVTCLVGVGVLGYQYRALRASEMSLANRTASISRMRADASMIATLQSGPQRAVDREKPNDELLAQIEAALHEAGVPRKLWQDSIPQPPQREKDSDYIRLATRLVFERISLQQVAGFANQLLFADPTIRVSSVRLHADSRKPAVSSGVARWNVELVTAYLVYEPQDAG